MKVREYGRAGTIGVGVPQANTTVEAELRALVPDGVNLVTARLQGSRSDSRTRLLDYFHGLGATLDSFDVAPLRAFGFACTGSSYLLGVEKDRAAFADLSRKRGYPVIPATEAILDALKEIGGRRIALVSPYPDWLTEAGLAYWTGAGVDIVEVVKVAAGDTADTRNVYDVTSADAVASAKRLHTRDFDALLMSGTGMPTLRAVSELSSAFNKPVLSSNLCLAWAMGRQLGLAGKPLWENRTWEAELHRL